MKLFVIVLCLLSERFLVHVSAHTRFDWFKGYSDWIMARIPKALYPNNPWVQMGFIILPPLILIAGLLYFCSLLLFGFVGLLLNLLIFYYCLGPGNPFYPERHDDIDELTITHAGSYLARVNGQLFAVLFWYIVLGPIGALAYRLVALCQANESTGKKASVVTDFLDWLPARMTALLYLLVGHFQKGFHDFRAYLLAPPSKNNTMLSLCGLKAASLEPHEPAPMALAERIVEHSLVLLLVIIAILTMVSWL